MTMNSRYIIIILPKDFCWLLIMPLNLYDFAYVLIARMVLYVFSLFRHLFSINTYHVPTIDQALCCVL